MSLPQFHNTVLGIDIGSRQSKGVLINKDKIYTALVPTGFFMQETAEEIITLLLEKSGIDRKDIKYIVSTGYGRIALSFDDIPNRIVTEIACHGMGAHYLGEDIHTVIDIGGQDSKVIKIDPLSGKVLDFAMNDKCAAGTGRFLERIANVLGLDVKEIGPESLKSEDAMDVSAQCIVFAESEVVSERAKGRAVSDIAYGIHKSVARRVYALLSRVGIEKNVLFTGGVSNNIGIKRAFEELLGFEISESSMDTVYAGALGAAAYADEYANEYSEEKVHSNKKFKLNLVSYQNAIDYQKELIVKKQTGKKKTVAYTCSYVPIEILASANVAYYRIMHAGNQDEIMAGESVTQSVFCDLTKSVLGEFITEKPIAAALDHVYTFFTCDCMRKTIEAVNSNYVPATIYNMPRLLRDSTQEEYYVTEIEAFKKDLEELTGEEITDSTISKNIGLFNKARELLREISEYRIDNSALVSSSDYQIIAHGFYYLPIDTLLQELRKILEQLENAKNKYEDNGPRLLLAGGIVADGDHKLTTILEDLGANIVAEDNCAGLRPFSRNLQETGDWKLDIARGYRGQAPCARMKPLNDVIDASVELAKKYKVEGAVFYYLKFCPTYSMFIKKYTDALQAIGVPVLVVSSDYSKGDEGQIKIRAEAFLEMIGGVKNGRDNQYRHREQNTA